MSYTNVLFSLLIWFPDVHRCDFGEAQVLVRDEFAVSAVVFFRVGEEFFINSYLLLEAPLCPFPFFQLLLLFCSSRCETFPSSHDRPWELLDPPPPEFPPLVMSRSRPSPPSAFYSRPTPPPIPPRRSFIPPYLCLYLAPLSYECLRYVFSFSGAFSC